MIPLHAFNAAKVLEGARVPIIGRAHPDDTPKIKAHIASLRYEWIGTDLLEIDPDRAPRLCDITDPEGLLLDPTDSDTARLIDRRIVVALYPKASGIVDAAMSCDLEQWRIVIVHRNAYGEVVTESVWFSYLPVIAVLSGLPASLANLPEARARLLCELYPPVAA